MAQKAIRECDAKMILTRNLASYGGGKVRYERPFVLVTPDKGLEEQARLNPWLKTEALVVKPDQLFGKRGKNRLILKNAGFDRAKAWIDERIGREFTVYKEFDADGSPLDKGTRGCLTHFLVEAFLPHEPGDEYYLALSSHREGDLIHFSPAGGVEIEENRDRLISLEVPTGSSIDEAGFERFLGGHLLGDTLTGGLDFLRACFPLYRDLHFGLLEFNPLVKTATGMVPLDVKARLDDTAEFICRDRWGDITFPVPFGGNPTREERYIEELDHRSGASLKLTVLNPRGRIWTMIAGGGASVIYADTVADLGWGGELANYGEYSGDPSTEETAEYARTILDLMTREPQPGGKVLLIGGGIANFTDVATTFEGIISALEDYAPKLISQGIRIYVRRGGPNYMVGLARIREAAKRLGIMIEVSGPEMHMTAIVKKAISTLTGGI